MGRPRLRVEAVSSKLERELLLLLWNGGAFRPMIRLETLLAVDMAWACDGLGTSSTAETVPEGMEGV